MLFIWYSLGIQTLVWAVQTKKAKKMRIGIIAEGTTDQAVLENILKGLGYDESDMIPIRPVGQYQITPQRANKF
jgi:hypothetical protein